MGSGWPRMISPPSKKTLQYFPKKNFKVLWIDNNKENLKKIKSLNLKNLIIYTCDITNHNKVEKLFKNINKSFFVDVLINNAAIDAIPFKKKILLKNFLLVKCGIVSLM